MEQFVFCETDQLREPLTGPRPAATVAGWEQARLHATGGFLGSVNLFSYLHKAWRLQLFAASRISGLGSLFGSIYGRHVATAKSKPRHEFSLCTHCPSKPHQPKKRFITIVVSIDEMAVIWTLSTWHFELICIVSLHSPVSFLRVLFTKLLSAFIS